MVEKTEAPAEVPAPPAPPPEPKAPDVETGKERRLTTAVFAPSGPVAKSAIIQAAIQSVRDAIPVVYELTAVIDEAGTKKATVDGVAGTSFAVTITYTPRAMAGGAEDPVDLDRVIKGLDVPTSVDGIFGHAGDPNFLKSDD